MKALIYGIIGGIFSFILFMLLYEVIGSKVIGMSDESTVILAGTIVLSTVICGCTGILVQKV